jgi:hypothetical protein
VVWTVVRAKLTPEVEAEACRHVAWPTVSANQSAKASRLRTTTSRGRHLEGFAIEQSFILPQDLLAYAYLFLDQFEAAKNISRFYGPHVQPTLFVEWAMVKEWRRIGRGGAVRSVSHATTTDA